MFVVREYGRTEEEAISKVNSTLLRRYPDEAYSQTEIKVMPRGNEDSDDKFVAEYTG